MIARMGSAQGISSARGSRKLSCQEQHVRDLFLCRPLLPLAPRPRRCRIRRCNSRQRSPARKERIGNSGTSVSSGNAHRTARGAAAYTVRRTIRRSWSRRRAIVSRAHRQPLPPGSAFWAGVADHRCPRFRGRPMDGKRFDYGPTQRVGRAGGAATGSDSPANRRASEPRDGSS